MMALCILCLEYWPSYIYINIYIYISKNVKHRFRVALNIMEQENLSYVLCIMDDEH